MIWVTVAVVAALLIGFALYFVLFRWRAMARHGRFPAPCDEVVDLPAGEHVIYYEDAERWRYSEPPRIGDGFSVEVSGADGGRIELQQPPALTPVKTSGRNRIPYGLLRAEEPGAYRVVARGAGAARNPHLTIG